MATIDLGKIKINWKGTYAGGTAYVVDDAVEYTDGSVTSSFICTTASTGNAPSSGGTVHGSWDYLAKGAAAFTSPLTTRGDIFYRDASGDARFAKGTAGHVLTATANDFSWSAPAAAVVKKIHYVEYGVRTAGNSNANSDQFDWGSLTFLDAANNDLWVSAAVPINCEDQNWSGFGLRFAGSSINVDTFGLGSQYVSGTGHMSIMSCQFRLAANTLNNNGGWTVYLRNETASSEPDYFMPNSSDDARVATQTKATLTIIEYKNS